MASEISEEAAELEYFLDEDGEVWFHGNKLSPGDILRHLRSYSRTIANQCAERAAMDNTICKLSDTVRNQRDELARLNAKVERMHGKTEND